MKPSWLKRNSMRFSENPYRVNFLISKGYHHSILVPKDMTAIQTMWIFTCNKNQERESMEVLVIVKALSILCVHFDCVKYIGYTMKVLE